MEIRFNLNGKDLVGEVPEDKTLLRFLREDLGLMGTKNGCEKGHCGSCTVLINGISKRSCLIKMKKVSGAIIETIENQCSTMDIIREAFITEGAVQCGFCTPGMIMSTKGLLDKSPQPTEEEIKKAFKHNLCRCTGYVSIINAVKQAAHLIQKSSIPEVPTCQGNVIGNSVIRKDVKAKVLGNPIYADDYTKENMLHGKLLFSKHAHAEIISIDISKAEELTGTTFIATGKDIPGRNSFGLLTPEQPVIATDRVKYLGDVVAVVFAESEKIALQALSLINVEYKILKPALSVIEAMEKNGPQINEKGNIAHYEKVRKGDIEEGFREADIIVEDTFYTPAVEHAYLEPESCMAIPNESEGVLIYTGSQGSVAMQDMIAKSLDIPQEKVRVIYTPCGGAFGGKEEPTIQIHAALGVMKTARPVKMTLSREDSIRISTKRHAMQMHMKLGATLDGKLIAFKSKVLADAGAYASLTKPVVFRSAVVAAGPYEIPNVKTDSYGIYTNNNPAGAFRGFGSTQVTFGAEILMDRMARRLNIDPIEFRKINGLEKGKITITGQMLKDGVGYIQTLDAIKNELNKITITRTDKSKRIGIGIASSYKNVGLGTGKPDSASAIVEWKKNDTFEVRVGATDLGQGSDTIMAQIAASCLGISYDKIEVISCDTLLCPDGGMTTASRQTYVTGNAVKSAAEQLKDRIRSIFGIDEINIEETSYNEAYAQAMKNKTDLSVTATYYPPKTYPLRDSSDHQIGISDEVFDIHYAYCFTSQVAIVEVDMASGDIRVLKIIAAQDVGKAIHPQNIRGQIEGAVVMGLGYALSEEFLQDDTKIITDNLHKLKIPHIADAPEIETIIIEENQPEGPFGAKGMGEVPINPVAPAIANAIYDATSIHITSLPIKTLSLYKD